MLWCTNFKVQLSFETLAWFDIILIPFYNIFKTNLIVSVNICCYIFKDCSVHLKMQTYIHNICCFTFRMSFSFLCLCNCIIAFSNAMHSLSHELILQLNYTGFFKV